jgi:hypothetical protein
MKSFTRVLYQIVGACAIRADQFRLLQLTLTMLPITQNNTIVSDMRKQTIIVAMLLLMGIFGLTLGCKKTEAPLEEETAKQNKLILLKRGSFLCCNRIFRNFILCLLMQEPKKEDFSPVPRKEKSAQ